MFVARCKAKRKAVLAVTMALVVGGCVEKRVNWSPDGRWAAVIGEDGLYICDEKGNLSPRVVEHARRAAWFADSRRLLIARGNSVKSWKEMSATLPEQTQRDVIAAAEKLRTEVLAHEGDWKEFEPALAKELTPGVLMAAVRYMLDERGEGLPEELIKSAGDIPAQVWTLQVYEISDQPPPAEEQPAADPQGRPDASAIGKLPGPVDISMGGVKAWARPGPVVLTWLDELLEPRVAPDGLAAAFLSASRAEGGEGRLMLLSLPGPKNPPQNPSSSDHNRRLEPIPPQVIDEHVAAYPDWTLDSQSLVYARANTPKAEGAEGPRLGKIIRRKVRGDDGRPVEAAGEPEVLAEIVFHEQTRVRCVKEGAVLFSAVAATLPATRQDMSTQSLLFSVNPAQSAAVTPLVPRDAHERVGDAAFLFEISPDGTRVSLPDSSGKVSVLILATGQLMPVQEITADDAGLRTLPVWRKADSADELCLAVPPGSPQGSAGRGEMALCAFQGDKVKGVRVISREWKKPAATFLYKEDQPTMKLQPEKETLMPSRSEESPK